MATVSCPGLTRPENLSFSSVQPTANTPSSATEVARQLDPSVRIQEGFDAHTGKIVLCAIGGALAFTLGIGFGVGTAGLGPLACLILAGCALAGGAIGGGTALFVATLAEDQARKKREEESNNHPTQTPVSPHTPVANSHHYGSQDLNDGRDPGQQ